MAVAPSRSSRRRLEVARRRSDISSVERELLMLWPTMAKICTTAAIIIRVSVTATSTSTSVKPRGVRCDMDLLPFGDAARRRAPDGLCEGWFGGGCCGGGE